MIVRLMQSNSEPEPTAPATMDPAADPGLPSTQLIESIVAELRGSLRELRCGTTERILGLGVSMTQMHVLWLLEHHGEVPVSRLAELLGVSVSNSTGLIDRMEDRALVGRRRAPDDRRVVLVELGPEGNAVLRDLEALHHERLRRALGRLDPERLSGVLDAFTEFRSVIEADLGPSTHTHRHLPTTPAPPAGDSSLDQQSPSPRP